MSEGNEGGVAGRMTFVLLLFVVVTLASAATFFSLRLYETVRRSPWWQIRHIQVEGLKRIQESEILGVVALREGMSLWDVRMWEVERRLAAHPWVVKAVVKWSFPGIVRVTVVERYPVAILCGDEDCYYVDAEGSLFSKLDQQSLAKESLPVLKYDSARSQKFTSGSALPGDILKQFLTLVQMLRDVIGSRWKEVVVSYREQDGFMITLHTMKILVGTDRFEMVLPRLPYVMRYGETRARSGGVWIDARYSRWAFVSVE